MFSHTQQFGLTGEHWAAQQLTHRGFDVVMVSRFFEDVDLIVNGCLPVEVKIARETRRPNGRGTIGRRWQFNLTRGRVTEGDMLLIAIVLDAAGVYWPFVIPSAHLVNRRHISITSHPTRYRGMWRNHLNCWGWVDYLLHRRYLTGGQLDLPLFREEQCAE